MSTPGERFAEAGNELIKGVMRIQFIVHRPTRDDQLADTLRAVAAICEELVGPYKIIIADLSRE